MVQADFSDCDHAGQQGVLHERLDVVLHQEAILDAVFGGNPIFGTLEELLGVPYAPVLGGRRQGIRFAAGGPLGLVFGLFAWLPLLPRLITDEVIEGRISTFFRQSETALIARVSHPER